MDTPSNVELVSFSVSLDLSDPTANTYTGTSTLNYFVSYDTCTTLLFHADPTVSFSSLKVTNGKKTAKIQSCIRGSGLSPSWPSKGNDVGGGRADTSSQVRSLEEEGSSDVRLALAAPGLTQGQWSVVIQFKATFHDDTKCGLYRAASGSILPVPARFEATIAGISPQCAINDVESPKSAVPYRGPWTLIASHFEVVEGRRAFPCVDTPHVRVPFTLTISTLRGAQVIANTSESYDLRKVSANHQAVSFEATRALPMYVLGFVVLSPSSAKALETATLGNTVAPSLLFDQLRDSTLPRGDESSNEDRVDVSVCCLPGSKFSLTETLKYAVVGVRLLTEFFGTSLPHSKLDIIALPRMSVQGMENDGIIFLTEALGVLAPSGVKRDLEMDQLAAFVAHELSHHWVGNTFGLSFAGKEGVCLVLEKQFGYLLRGKKCPSVGHLLPSLGSGTQSSLPTKSQLGTPSSPSIFIAPNATSNIRYQAVEGKELTNLTYLDSEIAMETFVNRIGFISFRKGLMALCADYAGCFVEDETFSSYFD